MGAIQDISENHKEEQIHLLTTKPYFELFKKNPFVHNVILDKRLSKFNLIYLYQLNKNLKKLKFSTKSLIFKILQEQIFIKIFYFQKQYLINGLVPKQLCQQIYLREEFDKNPVLNRLDHQLKSSGHKHFKHYEGLTLVGLVQI